MFIPCFHEVWTPTTGYMHFAELKSGNKYVIVGILASKRSDWYVTAPLDI